MLTALASSDSGDSMLPVTFPHREDLQPAAGGKGPAPASVRDGGLPRHLSPGRMRRGGSGDDAMNGAESLVRTLVGGGVNVCFANPGTSEMHFVAALDRVDGMRCVLGLFEGVVTGAADGYSR